MPLTGFIHDQAAAVSCCTEGSDSSLLVSCRHVPLEHIVMHTTRRQLCCNQLDVHPELAEDNHFDRAGRASITGLLPVLVPLQCQWLMDSRLLPKQLITCGYSRGLGVSSYCCCCCGCCCCCRWCCCCCCRNCVSGRGKSYLCWFGGWSRVCCCCCWCSGRWFIHAYLNQPLHQQHDFGRPGDLQQEGKKISSGSSSSKAQTTKHRH